MCLNPYHGGVLTLGGTDLTLATGPFQYTPLAFGEGYSVDMNQVYVNGKSIGLTGTHSVIVDSGTNTWVMTSNHFNSLYNTFQSLLCPSFPIDGVCGKENLFTGNCYKYTQADLALFPNISIALKGTTLSITGSQYLITNESGSNNYCLGIANTGALGLSIIGDVVMQAYYVAFDVEHSRLGWAPVNSNACMKRSLTESMMLLEI